MLYTVLAIWVSLVLAALIGAAVGAVLRSSSGRHQLRTLEDRLSEALEDAERNRAEAVRLSAAQSLGQNDATERTRLQNELRDARSRVEQWQSHVDSQDARIRELEGELKAAEERAVPLGDGEWQERAQRAEAEIERLNGELQSIAQSEGSDSDSAELVRLRQENETLHERVAELMNENPDLDHLRNEISELRATNEKLADRDAIAAERDRLSQQMVAISAADREEFDAVDDDQKLAWLEARNQWLQDRLDDAKNGEVPGDVDVPGLRARIEELESDLVRVREERDAANAKAAQLTSNGSATEGEAALTGEGQAEVARLRWRNRYLTSRVKYLEGKVDAGVEQLRNELIADPERAAQEAELSRLRARIAQLEREPRGRSGEDDQETYSLEWRNRYLSSRVRYLEQQLAERNAVDALSQDGAPRAAVSKVRLNELEARVAEADQMRERIAELEHTIQQYDARRDQSDAPVDGSSEEAPGGEGSFALEWRNRYLTSRVRYLEERLAELRGNTAEA